MNIYNFILKYIKLSNKVQLRSQNPLINSNEIKPIDYCIICDVINLNIYLNHHCNKCNTCHYKNKIYCTSCLNCYDPFNDKDIIKHRKLCLN